MASRFWVGGTGTWDASDTTHWASSTGGAGGQSVPGSSDTVTFDASSGGGTVTVGAAYNPSVTSITCGAHTGTLDFSANNNNVTLATFNPSGTGTRTLNMGSGTWTLTSTLSASILDFQDVSNLTLTCSSTTVRLTPSGSPNFRIIYLPPTAKSALGTLTIDAYTTGAGTSIYPTGAGSTITNLNLSKGNIIFPAAAGLTITNSPTWTATTLGELLLNTDAPTTVADASIPIA